MEKPKRVWKEADRERQRRAYLEKNPEPTGKYAIRTADPILRELFLIAYRRKIPLAEIARRINRTTVTLTRWKKGDVAATMIDVAIFAKALGYELALVEKKEPAE